MDLAAVVRELEARADPANVAGMARYGISSVGTLGVSVKELRVLARAIGRDHGLAAGLWQTGIHEARILAALVDEPSRVTEAQMEAWIVAVDSWDVCDQVCANLFDRTGPLAYRKALEWSRRDEILVRRAGFVLMATLAVHDKRASDVEFLPFVEAVRDHGADQRPLVNKAASWALRQIGKRNLALHAAAATTAEGIASDASEMVAAAQAKGAAATSGAAKTAEVAAGAPSTPGARRAATPPEARAALWLAGDVLRELRSPAVEERLRRAPRSPSSTPRP